MCNKSVQKKNFIQMFFSSFESPLFMFLSHKLLIFTVTIGDFMLPGLGLGLS